MFIITNYVSTGGAHANASITFSNISYTKYMDNPEGFKQNFLDAFNKFVNNSQIKIEFSGAQPGMYETYAFSRKVALENP